MSALDAFLYATGVVVWGLGGAVGILVAMSIATDKLIDYTLASFRVKRHFLGYVLWRWGKRNEPWPPVDAIFEPKEKQT